MKHGPARRLANAFPDILVLGQFDNGDCLNGNQIHKRVRSNTGVSLSTSILYPLLEGLEQQGLLAAAPVGTDGKMQINRQRKCYSITEKGLAYLEQVTESLADFFGKDISTPTGGPEQSGLRLQAVTQTE